MAGQEMEAAQLSDTGVEEFLASRRAAGCRRVPHGRSFVPLLDYLRDQGIIAAPVPAPATALDELIDRYRRWLVSRCCSRAAGPSGPLRWRAGAAHEGEVEQVGQVGQVGQAAGGVVDGGGEEGGDAGVKQPVQQVTESGAGMSVGELGESCSAAR